MSKYTHNIWYPKELEGGTPTTRRCVLPVISIRGCEMGQKEGKIGYQKTLKHLNNHNIQYPLRQKGGNPPTRGCSAINFEPKKPRITICKAVTEVLRKNIRISEIIFTVRSTAQSITYRNSLKKSELKSENSCTPHLNYGGSQSYISIS